MELDRRIAWVAPVAMLVMAAAMQPAAVARRAADPAPTVRACGGTPAGLRSGAAPAGVAWYRLDAVVDEFGSLAGRRLVAAIGDAPPLTLDLAAESFASGPVGGAVLVGDDDGARSRLRWLDVARACWSEVAVETAVIRSAVSASDGSATWEHRVDRRSRADLGVWQRAPIASGARRPVRVLPGLAPDPAAGPTFATDLSVASDGRLVVTSCGELACRTRVVDPGTRSVASVSGTGPALGVSGARLVAMAACSSLPCAVETRDLVSGAASLIATTDGTGVLGGPGDGLVVLPVAGAIDVAAVTGADVGAVPLHLAPVPRGSTASSGAEAPPGIVVLAPGGRIVDPSSAWRLDPATRRTTPLVEVTP
jgi:hypothetical protein